MTWFGNYPGRIKPIDSRIEEGHTKEYEVPCRICGKMQIRNIKMKETICFKCKKEKTREYFRKRKEIENEVLSKD